MQELAKAVVNVMKAVNSIGKNAEVGTGNSAYKGVSDKDVKLAYLKAMSDNGLCILPIEINDEVVTERWTEEDSRYGTKTKQQVFTRVKTKYKLLHVSGESEILAGYGHGVDSQDKSAGKATTYAMKYALLYTFMTPTGDIDDSDVNHSDETPLPPSKDDKPWLNKDSKEWKALEARVKQGEMLDISVIKKHFRISKNTEDALKKIK